LRFLLTMGRQRIDRGCRQQAQGSGVECSASADAENLMAPSVRRPESVSMRSFKFAGYGEAVSEVVGESPAPQGSEVLLNVEACGVCHSDLHVLDGFFELGDGKRLDLSGGRNLPFTLGHEIAGSVAALGPDATGPTPGERVVVYPWIGCGECAICGAGDEHLCADARALGIQVDGGYADQVLVPHPRYLLDFGDIPARLAATYACSGLTAYSALKRIETMAMRGATLIIGAGGVGMAALALGRALHDNRIVVADNDAAKREAALAAGADAVIDSAADGALRQLRKLTDGGPAAVVDFVGAESTASFAVSAVRKGGKIVVVGLFGGSLNLALPLLPLKSFTLEGAYVGSLAEMEQLMTLARAGKVPPLPIQCRGLDEANAVLRELREGRVIGRAVLTPGG
jgi:D-arabinose 1-dehydrogenase-like Zn-dependent alcohol dehydrogenase